MNTLKKIVSVLAIMAIMLVSFSVVASAASSPASQTIIVLPGQKVVVTFSEVDCYGISGDITYSNRALFTSVTPVESAYGEIRENSFILSSSEKVDCVVKLTVQVNEAAAVGDKCVVAFSDYLRVDNNETLEGPDGLTKTVTIEVGTEETVTDPEVEIKDTSKIFTDIKAKAWYKKYVDYAYSYGIFAGMSKTEFSPNSKITRAQFVQVLANLEGVDTSNRNVTTEFTDVLPKKWYTPAIKWASETKVVSGMGDGTFLPDANVTREQMCLMLTKYAEHKGLTLLKVEPKTPFADDAKISKWAKNAVYICQQADIVNGKGANVFDPKGTGIRAEASVMFTIFHQNYLA